MDTIQTYRSKPLEIQAVRVTLENMADIAGWANATVHHSNTEQWMQVKTVRGNEIVVAGHYLVRYPDGTFQTFQKFYFKSMFDIVEFQTVLPGPDGGFVDEGTSELEETVEGGINGR